MRCRQAYAGLSEEDLSLSLQPLAKPLQAGSKGKMP